MQTHTEVSSSHFVLANSSQAPEFSPAQLIASNSLVLAGTEHVKTKLLDVPESPAGLRVTCRFVTAVVDSAFTAKAVGKPSKEQSPPKS